MAYSVQFNIVFEAPNLLFYHFFILTFIYIAEIQLPDNGIQLLSRTLARVLPWLAIGDFQHIM
jgi:hypothetical protein